MGLTVIKIISSLNFKFVLVELPCWCKAHRKPSEIKGEKGTSSGNSFVRTEIPKRLEKPLHFPIADGKTESLHSEEAEGIHNKFIFPAAFLLLLPSLGQF